MDLLNNLNTIISIVMGIFGIILTLWTTLRRPVQLFIRYEPLELKPIDGSEDNLQEILDKLSSDEMKKLPCFVTFKVWNSGKTSVEFPDKARALKIKFNRGERILDCKKIATDPLDLDCAIDYDVPHIVSLVMPLFDPKESVTLRVLITDYANYFPEVSARIPGKKRIVRASNVRSSKENIIAAVVCICAAIFSYWFFPFVSVGHNSMAGWYFISTTILILVAGLLFFLTGWTERGMAPHSIPLPSVFFSFYLRLILRGLPILIIMGAIYALFGMKVFAIVYIVTVCLILPLGAWRIIYVAISHWFQKRNKAYNALLIGILTGIPFVTIIALCAYTFLNIWFHR